MPVEAIATYRSNDNAHLSILFLAIDHLRYKAIYNNASDSSLKLFVSVLSCSLLPLRAESQAFRRFKPGNGRLRASMIRAE